jgi:hypothetical protein
VITADRNGAAVDVGGVLDSNETGVAVAGLSRQLHHHLFLYTRGLIARRPIQPDFKNSRELGP